jgi:hypothetical protein
VTRTRSLPDARAIIDDLTRRYVKLSFGGVVHDPTDPVGRLLFNVLAMVAEFEADLIRLRNREGMKVAKAKGRLRAGLVGKRSTVSASQHQRQHPALPVRRRFGNRLACLPAGHKLFGIPGYSAEMCSSAEVKVGPEIPRWRRELSESHSASDRPSAVVTATK